jgi:hypothetical protein
MGKAHTSADPDGGEQARIEGKSRRTPRLVLHPVLFAAFPVLLLYAQNVQEGVELGDMLRPLAVVVGATLALFALAILAFRDAPRAGLAVSAVVILFFAYGRVASALDDRSVGGVDAGSSAALLPVWVVLGGVAVLLALRLRRFVPEVTSILNVVAGGLVALNVVTIVTYEVRTRADERAALQASDATFEGRLPDPRHVVANEQLGESLITSPDIYYLVFDTYAGAHVMRSLFGFDNEPFLRALEDRGLFVARRSTANYPRTSYSLASSLNMQYLDFLTDRMGTDSDDAEPLTKLIQNNRIARFLTSVGYRYVHVGSWWGATLDSPLADENVRFGGSSEFASVLYDTTALRPLSEDDFRTTQWKRAQFQFRAVEQAGGVRGPTFVFAHFLVPHAPFVFDRSGAFVTQEQEDSRTREENYAEQIQYVNSRVLRLVDHLLDQPSARRPLIILQADEGPFAGAPTVWRARPSPALDRKFPILNALYLPGKGNGGLDDSITPVNTFRAVLNLYFDAGLPLLEDRNYIFRSLDHLFDFTDVTDLVRSSVESGMSTPRSQPGPAG